MKLFKTTLIAAAVAAIALAGNASAATAGGTLNAKIVITEACAFSSTGAADVDFGSKSRSQSANVDTTGTLVVNCTPGTGYKIGLGKGANGASVTTRKLSNGTATVPYALYRDTGRTQNWGETVGTDTMAGTGDGSNQSITVYGRVLAADTNVAAGTYTDTITATITY